MIYLAWSETRASVEDETDLHLFFVTIHTHSMELQLGLGMRGKHHALSHAYPNPLVPMVKPHQTGQGPKQGPVFAL